MKSPIYGTMAEMDNREENNLISLETSAFRWRVAPRFRQMVERFEQIVNHGALPAVKASRVRKTFFIPGNTDHPSLVLKEYKTKGLGAILRTWILGTPAQREATTIAHLKAHGLAVPPMAALGTPLRFTLRPRTVLALVRIEESCTLEEILLGQKDSPLPHKELAARLGYLVRGMHDAGVLHKDLHAANLLVDARCGLYVVDLHGAVICSQLPFRRRIRDLVSLAGAFMVHGRKSDRLRFFRAYHEGNGDKKRFKALARRIEQMSRTRLYTFLEKFDYRSLRSGRQFQALEIHELTGMAEPSDRARALARRLGPYPHETLEEAGQRIHRTDTSAVYRFGLQKEQYIIKVYEKPGVTEGAKRFFRGSRGRQCWFNYHRLFFRGISVPKPVLFLEEPPHSPSGRSFVATEAEPDRVTLDRFMETADDAARALVSRRLAETVARMHTLFLRNRDMKAQNILIGPQHEISFIDPDGIASMREPSLYFMARDLMRINASFGKNSRVSLADRIRFLKAYTTCMQLPRTGVRELWRETLHLTWIKWDQWKKWKQRKSFKK